MRGIVHHIDLTVRDPKTSFALYDAVLTALGYRLEREDQRGFDWRLESPLGAHSIGIAKASPDGAGHDHDRYSPGLHHLVPLHRGFDRLSVNGTVRSCQSNPTWS